MNKQQEDYLKLIYKFTTEKEEEFVKTKEIANELNLTFQSVNEMLKKLQENNFLEFIPYKGVRLTKKGLDEALRITKIHRIWEVFLVDKLGLSWKDVHLEAELLEHATTDVVAEALYNYLGRPKTCTHGNPIPQNNKTIPELINTNLADLNVGEELLIKRVQDDYDLLEFLEKNNVTINSIIQIIKIDKLNDILEVKVNERNIVISRKVASMIYGEIK